MQNTQTPAAGNTPTAPNYLRWSTRQWPDHPAMSDGETTLTYRDVDRRADLVGRILAHRGLGRGHRVGILMSNRAEYAELLFGIARRGAAVVPLNFRLTARELTFQFDDCTPTLVFVERRHAEVARRAAQDAHQAPELVVIDPEDGGSYLEGDVATLPEEPAPEIADSDPFLILYTSGTTGKPKGAVSTHQAFCFQATSRIIAQGIPVGTGSAWLSGLQLFHLGGLASLLPSIMSGGHFITVSQSVKGPAQVLELLQRHGVETCSLIPTQWDGLLAAPGINGADLNLKRVSIGTMASSVDLFERVGRLVPGLSLFNSFGQTETAGITCSLSGDEAVRFPGSVGRPVIGNDVRLVDENMNDVADGQSGEIVYQGPAVCQEYWNNPEGTAEAWRGGWFHSGDIARRDEHGRIWILDRKKDMIISGGENIYPAEIEQVLVQHPSVVDVAVVGLPDPKWGETPCALVVPTDVTAPPEVSALLDHVTSQLASYKKPAHFLFVDDLPRSATGKLQKIQLREWAAQLLTESHATIAGRAR